MLKGKSANNYIKSICQFREILETRTLSVFKHKLKRTGALIKRHSDGVN